MASTILAALSRGSTPVVRWDRAAAAMAGTAGGVAGGAVAAAACAGGSKLNSACLPLSAGFVSAGAGTITVLVRAIGPSLAQFGIAGVLADPTLRLIDGNGATIDFNDNWKDTQQALIEATGKAPINDLEAAILATLPPGPFTAIVSGKNGGSGIGLVDVFKQ